MKIIYYVVGVVIVQLSLSPITIQNLYRIRGNPATSIEYIIRGYNTYGFPAPRIVSSRQSKQSINVQLAPYVTGILESFASYGMNKSQVVEWLTTDYINSLKETEPPEQKVPKVKQPQDKSKQSKVRTEHLTNPEKEPFIHVSKDGPKVRKTKIKPTR